MTFQQKLDISIEKDNSLLCVGLDPVMEKIPAHLHNVQYPFYEFSKAIADATHDIVCCYKPNSAFFEARGAEGVGELKMLCDYIKTTYPEIPILLDFKRGDIGNTNNGYVQFAFEYLNADAVTVQPYLGKEALTPFLERKDKGIFILCKTSNPGSGEFQNLETNNASFYMTVANNVAKNWNMNNNCYLVVGATYPEELKNIRETIGDMVILAPGVGAQGADIESLLKAGLTEDKKGLIISSSREVIHAGSDENFSQKAREKAVVLRDKINKYRKI